MGYWIPMHDRTWLVVVEKSSVVVAAVPQVLVHRWLVHHWLEHHWLVHHRLMHHWLVQQSLNGGVSWGRRPLIICRGSEGAKPPPS